MKGVALAIETIIFIILAVLVLTVLLSFFTTVGNPPITQIELEQKRGVFCGQYVRSNFQCDSDGSKIPNFDVRAFANICDALKVANCESSSANCFAKCCELYCGKK